MAERFGVVKTPQAFVLKRNGNTFRLKYKGAIDNKPRYPKYNNTKYLEKALDALLRGKSNYRKETVALGTKIRKNSGVIQPKK